MFVEDEIRWVNTSNPKFHKNASGGVYSYAYHRPPQVKGAVRKSPINNLATPPPVPARPPPSSPKAIYSQGYEIPVPFNPIRLRRSNDGVKYQSPQDIGRASISADNNKDRIYSSIENEDLKAEGCYNEPANEYEMPDDLRRCDIAVNEYETLDGLGKSEYETPDDLRRSNPGADLDSNGYLMIIEEGAAADEKGYFRMGSMDKAPICRPPKPPPYRSPVSRLQRGLEKE